MDSNVHYGASGTSPALDGNSLSPIWQSKDLNDLEQNTASLLTAEARRLRGGRMLARKGHFGSKS
jgi:hypothetical protein